MRWLLGNGKWYQLRLRSRWYYQFSNEHHNLHKGIFKSVETVYKRENLGLSEKQGIGRFRGRLFGNLSHNRATLTIKRHFMESTKWLQKWLSPNDLFINEIFSLDEFHCNIYSLSDITDVSHFSKSENIWSFCVNCSNSQSYVLLKPLPVQISLSANLTAQSSRVIQVNIHSYHVRLYQLFSSTQSLFNIISKVFF